jgi:cytochrome P450
LTSWRLAWDEWQGKRTQRIHLLHQEYGPAVRIGPNEVSFNSTTAMKTIYGAGSGFEKTTFYRMFDAYGKQNIFTFASVTRHAERKKLLAHAYSKGRIVKGEPAEEIEQKVQDYLKWIESNSGKADEIFRSLHFFSLDNITNFLYPPGHGGTKSLVGDAEHQAMLDDMLDPARRKLTWFVVHFPTITKWLYARTGLLERLVAPILPMQKPATYTRMRIHALKAMESFRSAVNAGDLTPDANKTVIERLWMHHESVKKGGLSDLEIASECSDHFLAGIDTTSDTTMFLIWALSLPSNHKYQSRVIEEALDIPGTSLNKFGNPTVEAGDRLPYLDAVIKETLRVYAPIPESEPREPPQDTVIDGYSIPARTVVSLEPYALHRNVEVFPEPLKFNPERWLNSSEQQLTEMKRWWWAFSSGGRMCIGMHLAMAEMVALVPAIYRKYRTNIKPGFEGKAPGIVSRFEVFADETFEHTEEHTCWIRFERQQS